MSKILDQVLAGTTPQFDNDESLATTAFVQRALGNFQKFTNVSANKVLTAADTGTLVAASAPGNFIITLPSPATPNLHFRIYNACELESQPITVTTPAGAIHRGGNGLASTTLPSAGSLDVFSDGVNWIASNGAGKSTFGQNGCERLGSGLVLQWGLASAIPAGSNQAITLPMPFRTAALVAFATFVNTGGDATAANQIAQVRALTTTTLTLRNMGSAANTFYWFAIGT